MMDTLNTKQIGNIAEDRACNYLQAQGLKLVTRNYTSANGEIDLIMRDNDDLVFIEVRSQNKNFTNALESIDEYKQAKLIKTATYYLQKHKLYDKVNCRFDVIAINNNQLEWIKNAFSADNF